MAKYMQQFLEGPALGAGLVQQTLADGGAQIAATHSTASRYGRITFSTRSTFANLDRAGSRLPRPFTVSSQGFDGDVEPDLVSVLEAVRDRLLRRIHSHGNLVDRDDIDARAEGRIGVPEYA